MRIVVINPTYNEKENIQELVKRIAKVKDSIEKTFQAEFIQLVVDDTSPDGTGEVVKKLSIMYPFLRLIEGQKKALVKHTYAA